MENNHKNQLFTDDEKTGITRYGAVLLGIHTRLVVEGYFLAGGRIWNIFKVATPVFEIEWDENCQIKLEDKKLIKQPCN